MTSCNIVLILFCSSYAFGDILNITDYLIKGQAEKARKLSEVDPKFFAGVKSHSGFINVDVTSQWNLFFWYFPVENPINSPWIIWLQGGPGQSSLIGLFDEIGPLQFVNSHVEKMPISWGSNYSLLFIDNPVGTGFSFSNSELLASNQSQIGSTLLNFIQQFLLVFPELRKTSLYISGEDYGGKFVTSFGHHIRDHNKQSNQINLKGLAISSGFIHPVSMLHYSEWAEQMGFASNIEVQEMSKFENKAQKYWNNGDMVAFKQAAVTAYTEFQKVVPVNRYNYLKNPNDNIINLDFVKFINQKEIREALHVGDTKYEVINESVRKAFDNDYYESVKTWLEGLLEDYKVLFYSGQLATDMAYPFLAHMYNSFNWSGAKDYYEADRLLYANDKTSEWFNYGYVKSTQNFMEVMINRAGQMPAIDKPKVVKYFVDTFIHQ